MAGVVARHGTRRRTMNEINMVPFIDVMLVLLIIFMVTAPLITTGLVDLPTVGKTKPQPQEVIEIVIAGDERVQVKLRNQEPEAVDKSQLTTRIRQAQRGDAEMPVVIAADKGIRYEAVVDVMRLLRDAEIRRVGLAVKQTE